MTTSVAFLRGVNLGKRRMKMADLRAACEAMGLGRVKTILASGNVRFDTGDEGGLKERLESGLSNAFAFRIGVILRTADEIEAMIGKVPFGKVDPKADVALHVLMSHQKLDPKPDLSARSEYVEVPRIDEREIYFVAHRQPNGRYTEGIDKLDLMLPKGIEVTMRNWNTILKVLA
jgi:uncharacterized protein (DUF1697 family)